MLPSVFSIKAVLKTIQLVAEHLQGVACVGSDGGSEPAGGMGTRDGEDGCPGEHLPPWLPSPWEPGGFVPRHRRVPGRCCRCSSAATSRPEGDAERGGTAGIARRCRAGPGGADGEPPPAVRHGIAISLRFW